MSEFKFLESARLPTATTTLGSPDHTTSLPSELGTGTPDEIFDFQTKPPRTVAEYLHDDHDEPEEVEYREWGMDAAFWEDGL